MPGTDELMARLTQLEQGYYGDREAARQKQFFDTYGSRFSNNQGLGLAILNELDARGIDTSAADEAVGEILDNLRTDCNEILNLIKGVQEQAIDTAQKVETVANVVQEQVASNPEASISPTGPEGVPEPVDIGALSGMDPNGEFNPEAVPPAEEPPAEPPAEESAPAEEPPAEPPAEEPPAEESAPEAELPPTDTVSDVRTKRVNKMKAIWGKTNTQKKRESTNAKDDSYKPSSGILAACGGKSC